RTTPTGTNQVLLVGESNIGGFFNRDIADRCSFAVCDFEPDDSSPGDFAACQSPDAHRRPFQVEASAECDLLALFTGRAVGLNTHVAADDIVELIGLFVIVGPREIGGLGAFPVSL